MRNQLYLSEYYRFYKREIGVLNISYFRTIYKCPHANALMSSLLHFVSKMVPVPSTMFGTQLGGSFVVGIAESIWSLLSFRKPLDPLETNDLPNAFREQYPLANQSLLLILILTNHRTAVENPFRVSLFGCADTKGNQTIISVSLIK